MANKVVFSIRIDEKIVKKIDEKAQHQNRTRNNLIETVLLQYLQSDDTDPPLLS